MERIDVGQLPNGRWEAQVKPVPVIRGMGDTKEEALKELAERLVERKYGDY